MTGPRRMGEGGGTALVVLGMHRSGTSAAARVSNLLGVDFGDDSLPADAANPRGYWEDRRLLALDEALLAALGSRWHDAAPLPDGWTTGAAAADYRRDLATLLADIAARAPLWGIKDPRLCRLLPAAVPLLSDCRILFVLRRPGAVARSLVVRDSLPEARGIALWLRSMIEAEAATRHLPRAFLVYPRLLADWRGEMDRVADRLRLRWPILAERAAAAIDAYLVPDLDHHGDGGGATAVDWVEALWDGFLAAADGAEQRLVEAADRVSGEVGRADAVWAPLLAASEAGRREAGAALTRASAALADAASGLEERNLRIARLERERSEAEAVVRGLERRLRGRAENQ